MVKIESVNKAMYSFASDLSSPCPIKNKARRTGNRALQGRTLQDDSSQCNPYGCLSTIVIIGNPAGWAASDWSKRPVRAFPIKSNTYLLRELYAKVIQHPLRQLAEKNIPNCAGFSFGFKARGRRIVHYAPVIATQKLDDKDKQVGIFFDRNRLSSSMAW